jgi:hypothetical protein
MWIPFVGVSSRGRGHRACEVWNSSTESNEGSETRARAAVSCVRFMLVARRMALVSVRCMTLVQEKKSKTKQHDLSSPGVYNLCTRHPLPPANQLCPIRIVKPLQVASSIDLASSPTLLHSCLLQPQLYNMSPPIAWGRYVSSHHPILHSRKLIVIHPPRRFALFSTACKRYSAGYHRHCIYHFPRTLPVVAGGYGIMRSQYPHPASPTHLAEQSPPRKQ